ncbi:MAG: HIT domain-containing protein [Bryobacterales bacterium]|nr:HIT domain-containing protein [Bryobacterales bacterium]
MDYLWTPWRYRYVSSKTDESAPESREHCVFCRILASDTSDRDALIVHRAEHNFVILNRYPYTSGHMLVVPFDHVASLAEAPCTATEEMMRLTRQLERVLRSLYAPDGINIGMNIGRAGGAGVAGHVHMHALPRWIADSNFATVIGETRVLPEALAVTWERVRAEIERASV